MATFVSGLYVGTFGSRTLNINVSGNISRNGTTVTLTSISCYLYAANGGHWYAAQPRTWGLRAPGGEAVSTSVPYSPSAGSRTFSLPNLSFYLDILATSCTMYVTGPDGSFAFTLGGIPQGAVAPSGLSVSISSIADTGASFSVSLSSYGTPSSADGRYIEASIMGQSTYGGKYRYDIAKNKTSSTITVNNSSKTNSSNPLTIVPNTQYWYGAYATNTSLSISKVQGTFVTRPAYITSITAHDVGQGEVYFTVNHAAEGSANTVVTELSYDQQTWQTVSDEFNLSLSEQTTLYVRRSNNSGSTPVFSISVTPSTRVKLYGSVNNQAQEIKKLYGSVNSQSVRIRKLYASVNGRSKLIFVESNDPWSSRGSGTAGDPYIISSSYGDTIS